MAKIFSTIARILLILTTTVVSLASLAILGLGIWGLITRPTFDSPDVNVSINLRPVFITLVVVGLWISTTSLAGCFGAIRKSKPLLRYFIWALVFDALLIIAAGGYAVYNLVQNRNVVRNISRQDYISWGQAGWLTTQNGFNCCGYFQGDFETTYIGSVDAVQNIRNDTATISGNPCTTREVAATLPGCYDTAVAFYNVGLTGFGAGLGIIIGFIVFSILLAVVSSRAADGK